MTSLFVCLGNDLGVRKYFLNFGKLGKEAIKEFCNSRYIILVYGYDAVPKAYGTHNLTFFVALKLDDAETKRYLFAGQYVIIYVGKTTAIATAIPVLVNMHDAKFIANNADNLFRFLCHNGPLKKMYFMRVSSHKHPAKIKQENTFRG